MANQLDSPLQSPHDVRMAIRNDDLPGPTSGLAPGYLQANLVIVPQQAVTSPEPNGLVGGGFDQGP